MEPNRIAALLLVAGSVLGLAGANLVETRAVSAPVSYPTASAEDYPEISAVSFENIPGPVAPVIRRGPMQLASWERPWIEPLPLPPETTYAGIEDDGAEYDRSPENNNDQPDEPELIEKPVEMSLTLAAHP